MKNYLHRYLTITGVLMTSLLLFINLSRQWNETRLNQVRWLESELTQPLVLAKGNFRNLAAADPESVNKGVVSTLESVRGELQKLYDGKGDLGEKISDAEEVRMLVKLSLVELDRTIEGVKLKSAATDFDKSLTEVHNVTNHFSRQAARQHSFLQMMSWILVVVLLFIFGAILVWSYRTDRRRRDDSTKEKEQLRQETGRVNTLSNFIEAMATGNYSIQLDSETKDELSATLVSMRDKLKGNAEEDQRRNWATSGLAQIGEILRTTTQTSSDLYDSIIKFVVKYTKSNQGGLFIVNDDDTQNICLELVACYAFERKKFLTKRIDPGQGLVGQCYLEMERIHLREVPQDYVRITSGLGGENPGSCLIVPLKVNDKIFGVLELASFNLYANYEIELVEKLAETIASTISSVKINESTRMLLERTQQQAEEMKSQEEEMRQNMEELSATQEEMQRKEREYILRIQELEERVAVVAT